MDLKGKKLLVLGATSETEKLVQQANSMGVETYIVDPYLNSPAKKYAAHSILLDCFEVEKICQIIKDENIDGVLPGCADILIPVYEEVCRVCNKYCYVNKKLVSAFNNKLGLKEILRKYGLKVIGEYSKEEVGRKEFDSFPVFVKPVDNNSSKGMSVANNLYEFEKAYKKAMDFSHSRTVLIEDYKKCDDFYIGYFAQDGNIEVAFTGDRFVIEQKDAGSITAGIVYPSKFEKLYFETVHSKMMEIFAELQFENGICAIQGFIENGQIMFYDPALRITGGQEYVLIKHFTGIDELRTLIQFALSGRMSDVDEYKKCDCTFGGKYGCNLTFSVKPCEIGKIEGIEFAKSCSGVLNVTQERRKGDTINQIGTAQQNFSRIHIVADSKEELRNLILLLQNKVKAYDVDGKDVMLTGLNPDEWYRMREDNDEQKYSDYGRDS